MSQITLRLQHVEIPALSDLAREFAMTARVSPQADHIDFPAANAVADLKRSLLSLGLTRAWHVSSTTDAFKPFKAKYETGKDPITGISEELAAKLVDPMAVLSEVRFPGQIKSFEITPDNTTTDSPVMDHHGHPGRDAPLPANGL